ncbi:MAG TPA: J domain-containing protein [Acidimicrobiales bacterium]|nr:J domain-containing protein [Acidimicrobiales bacterium]
MSSDAFAVLGLAPTATLDEVRAARRRLALALHPDRAVGDPEAERRMQEVNAAFDQAVKAIRGDRTEAAGAQPAPEPEPRVRRVARISTDVASFVVECMRPEAFERLFIVSHWVGEPLYADPPGLLEVHLEEPWPCFCRLELMPEAGATMVSVTVGTIEPAWLAAPDTDTIRDIFILLINQLGADDLEERTDP